MAAARRGDHAGDPRHALSLGQAWRARLERRQRLGGPCRRTPTRWRCPTAHRSRAARRGWSSTASPTAIPRAPTRCFAAVLAFSRDPLTSFNPVLAVMMAFAAFPAYWLIRRQLASAPLAGIGAAGAAAGYLQFGFYSQGFMPQLAVTALLFGALGLGLRGDRKRVARTGRDDGLHGFCGRDRLFGRGRRLSRSSRSPGRSSPWLWFPASRSACASCCRSSRLLRERSPSSPSSPAPSGSGDAAAAAAGDPAAFIRRPRKPARPRGHAHRARRVDRARLSHSVHLHPPDACRDGRGRLPRDRGGGRRACDTGGSPSRRSSSSIGAGAVYVSHSSSIYYTAKTYQVAAFPIACAVVAGAAALTRAPVAATARRAGGARRGAAARRRSRRPWSSASARPPAQPQSRRPSSDNCRRLDAIRRHTLGLALVHDDWTKALLPNAAVPYDGSFGAHVRPGLGFAGIIDTDSIDPRALERVDWIVEPRLGGTSFPPTPFRPGAGLGGLPPVDAVASDRVRRRLRRFPSSGVTRSVA